MMYFACQVACAFAAGSPLCLAEDADREARDAWKEEVAKISAACGIAARDEELACFVYEATPVGFSFAVLARDSAARVTPAGIISCLKAHLGSPWDTLGCALQEVRDCTEITQREFGKCLERGVLDDFIVTRMRRDVFRLLDLADPAQSTGRAFRYEERLADAAPFSAKACRQALKGLLVDASLKEELKRIYAKANKRGFYGYPVHYHLRAGTREEAFRLAEVLVRALHAQKRLTSLRLNIVSDFFLRDFLRSAATETLAGIADAAKGGAVVLVVDGDDESDGEYASTNHALIDALERLLRRYHEQALFLLIDTTGKASLAPKLMELVQDKIPFCEIREGNGTRKQAVAYAELLQEERQFPAWDVQAFQAQLTAGKEAWRMSEVRTAYDYFCRAELAERIYPAYAKAKFVQIAPEKRSRSSGYDELAALIGLTEVKGFIERVLAVARNNQARSRLGLPTQSQMMHLAFLGNPGTAKTTVARLLARILADEQILDGDIFVECGRADLVGKFVGWTAPLVKQKFRDAEGGILFIDEAYSLVEHRQGLFGDEAINTLVQEMENRRERTMVIFAGYPERMREFLARNEGLRSRVGFTLNFPDYTPEELVQILEKKAKETGYRLTAGAREQCLALCREFVRQKDFGNGRFARNLLKEATLNQAERLASQDLLVREQLELLTAEDFAQVAAVLGAQAEAAVGFRVAG